MGLDGGEGVAFLGKLLGEQLVAKRILARHDDAFEIAHAADDVLDDGIERLGDEQHAGAAVGQHIGILIQCQQRVERHRHDAGADRTEKYNREIDHIQHDHGDALFAAHAKPAQHVGGAARLPLQVAIVEVGHGVGEGELVAAALVNIAVEQPGHRVVRAHAALPRESRAAPPQVS